MGLNQFLEYRAIPESIHVRLNSVEQRQDVDWFYVEDAQGPRIVYPDEAVEEGFLDRYEVHYAYMPAAPIELGARYIVLKNTATIDYYHAAMSAYTNFARLPGKIPSAVGETWAYSFGGYQKGNSTTPRKTSPKLSLGINEEVHVRIRVGPGKYRLTMQGGNTVGLSYRTTATSTTTNSSGNTSKTAGVVDTSLPGPITTQDTPTYTQAENHIGFLVQDAGATTGYDEWFGSFTLERIA